MICLIIIQEASHSAGIKVISNSHIQKSQINYKYMGTNKLNRIYFISV